MAHGSETNARLGGFLQKDAVSRFVEGRFNVAPINLDSHAPDANAEKLKQTVALNPPAAVQFYRFSPIGGTSRDTRLSAGCVGRVFAGVTFLGFAAMALSALLRMGASDA